MKVFIYYNLNSGKWSLKACEGQYKGLVIGHADQVLIDRAMPSVSITGRDRVRATGVKGIHAGLIGNLVVANGWQAYKGRTVGVPWAECDINPQYDKIYEITYNPYKYDTFVYKATGSNYNGPAMALLNNDSRVYVTD